MIITDYIGNLALEAGKSYFHDKIDEKKLKKALSDYIEHHRKYNEVCTIAEEIDFQGLIDYIQSNLLDDVATRMFSHNKTERRNTREHIINKALYYSHADSDEAKHRVKKIVSITLDIIHNFYLSLNKKDYLITSLIVDEVHDDTRELLQSSENRLTDLIEKSRSLVSMDKAVELSKSRDFRTIENGIENMIQVVSTNHPLFPDYGYELYNNKLRSKPLTKEAMQKHPPKYVFHGHVKVGDKPFHTPQENPFDYSYRHQLPITFEISEAEKYLGDQLDPKQDEILNFIGKTITANPPEFPTARPYSIMVGTETCFEYILLRTQEILDDGTKIISNKEQGNSIIFMIKTNPHSPDHPEYMISMNRPNNHDILQYVKFVFALEKYKDIHIHDLSTGKDWIAGHIENFSYKSGFPSIEEEIDFIERVCCIEDYFGVVLNPEGDISLKEIDEIRLISNLIQNELVPSQWEQATLTGIVNQDSRQRILAMNDNPFMFSYVGISQVKLFGAHFDVKYLRTYMSAQIVDLEKLKKKVELMDDGETIKIHLKPANDKTAADTLRIPDDIMDAKNMLISSPGQFLQST